MGRMGWGRVTFRGPSPRAAIPLFRRGLVAGFLSLSLSVSGERFQTPEFGLAISLPKAPLISPARCQGAAVGAGLSFGPVWGVSYGAFPLPPLGTGCWVGTANERGFSNKQRRPC